MTRDRLIIPVAASTITIALAVLCATVLTGWRQLRAAPAQSYAAGDKIDLPVDSYANAEQTLVLFVRESCAVCQAEAPHLAALIERVGSSSTSVQTLVVTGSSRVAADLEFSARLKAANHRHIPFETLRVKTVPTVLLVDRRGTVVFSQEGRFKTPNMMEELIRRIPSR